MFIIFVPFLVRAIALEVVFQTWLPLLRSPCCEDGASICGPGDWAEVVAELSGSHEGLVVNPPANVWLTGGQHGGSELDGEEGKS